MGCEISPLLSVMAMELLVRGTEFVAEGVQLASGIV